MNERVFESFPVIELNGIRLRRLELEDADQVFKIGNDLIAARYMIEPPLQRTEQAKRLIVGMNEFFEKGERIRWGIATSNDNLIIGHCGFFEIDKINQYGEISYRLDRDYWGKGIMTQTIKEVVRFSFKSMELHRIQATVIPENVGSVRVLEKCGFKREGEIRECIKKEDKYYNKIMFSIIDGEYKNYK